MPEYPEIEGGGEVLVEKKTKLEKPKLFKVILHNDDFTTMDFVVFVLQYVFNRSRAGGVYDHAKSPQRGLRDLPACIPTRSPI